MRDLKGHGKKKRASWFCQLAHFIKHERLLLRGSKSLLELVNASAGVNKLLLTGEERVALGADVNSLLAALGGSGHSDLTASATNGANFVLRMNSVFHCNIPLFKNLMFFDIREPRHARQTKVLYHKPF